ncbi:MAG: hypothetical protein ACRDOU_21695, partial [Streptosporangiaceae bacterium]
GNLLITTFSIAYDAAPRMQITPKNANAAALMADGLYAATTTTTTTWTLSLCGTASASQAYIFGVLTFQ